jgi:hypothetical protein
MTGPRHEYFRDDTAAYLLGALEDAERAAFELHMGECGECRHEVETLRAAADALPRSVDQLAPPPSLRAALMDEVDGAARPERRRRPALAGWLRPALVAATLLLGLVAGWGVAELGGDEDDARTIAAQVDGGRLPTASARLRVEGDGRRGAVLTADGLPDLGGRRVYQAWVQRGERLEPQPTFVADRAGTASVALPADLGGASAVLVTRERRGGARTPGEQPVMRVEL